MQKRAGGWWCGATKLLFFSSRVVEYPAAKMFQKLSLLPFATKSTVNHHTVSIYRHQNRIFQMWCVKDFTPWSSWVVVVSIYATIMVVLCYTRCIQLVRHVSPSIDTIPWEYTLGYPSLCLNPWTNLLVWMWMAKIVITAQPQSGVTGCCG
jgi:hypothetical protein